MNLLPSCTSSYFVSVAKKTTRAIFDDATSYIPSPSGDREKIDEKERDMRKRDSEVVSVFYVIYTHTYTNTKSYLLRTLNPVAWCLSKASLDLVQ